ncbi:hypothetical protein F5876DRAFT_83048 [Lentinula aff. lateritia]|uniref:Uncharacterized protein n=1 Tax=Lentinula aff. lateritia TaxID=2804960 RepID=A0ACC1TJB6_9AGAR|nr:hypothetical protein F5876DRAFT_83048 [Lentinula aff. lateritia]
MDSTMVQNIGIQLEDPPSPSKMDASPRPSKCVRFPPGSIETREEWARLRAIKFESAFRAADSARGKCQKEIAELKVRLEEAKVWEESLQTRQEQARLRAVQYYAAFKASQCQRAGLQDEVKQLRKEVNDEHIVWQMRLEAEKSASASREANLQADIDHLRACIHAMNNELGQLNPGTVAKHSLRCEELQRSENANDVLQNVAQGLLFSAEHQGDPRHVIGCARGAVDAVQAEQKRKS